MNQDFISSGEVDHQFEDAEDCLEFVCNKIEEAACYWKIFSGMFFPEASQQVTKQALIEMITTNLAYYDTILAVQEAPDQDGPFQIKAIIARS